MNPTVGEILRQTRIRLNRSLGDVSAATHIRRHFLESLENDKPEQIPSQAQARGFLRLYATFLGIPAEPLLSAWDQPDPLPDKSQESTIPPRRQKTIALPKLNFGLFLFNLTKSIKHTLINKKGLRKENQLVVTPEITKKDISTELPPDDEFPISENVINLNLNAPEFIQTFEETCQEIGKDLRERRELLDLSLEDVELHTRMKRHHIASLEDGRMEDLPSPIQGRGMLNNYAQFLNLDADSILSRYAVALQERRKIKSEVTSATNLSGIPKIIPSRRNQSFKKDSKDYSFITPLKHLLSLDFIIGAFLILALFGFIVWGSIQIINMQTTQTQNEAPSISEILLTTPSLSPEISITPDVEITATPTIQVSTGETGSVVSPTATLQNAAPLQMVITSIGRAYVTVSIDGSVRFAGRVNPGEVQSYTGYSLIEISTGNAAALQVIFNQENLGTLGENGQVLHLIFTATGMQIATPIFSITPTLTQLPTLTTIPSPTVPTPTVTPLVP